MPKHASRAVGSSQVAVAERRSAGVSELPLFASALRRARPVPTRLDDLRPARISSGLAELDELLGGGFPLGAVTLVAARPRVGASSLLLGAGLVALENHQRVAVFSERMREEQVRGRMVVIDSRVNGFRFRAGLASAEDRMALSRARQRIPWNCLSGVCARDIPMTQIDSHLFGYRPWLVLCDLQLNHRRHRGRAPARAFVDELEQLADLARRHRVAIVVRVVLEHGSEAPELVELPGLGRAAEPCGTVLLLHRDTGSTVAHESSSNDDLTPTANLAPGRAEARLVWLNGREIAPRSLSLHFDQRFAGFVEGGR